MTHWMQWLFVCCCLLRTSGCEHNGDYSTICRARNMSALPAASPPGVKLLEFTGNHVATLPADCFHGFPDLTRLFLNENNIARVENNAFRGLDDLRVLFLATNQITTLDNTVFLTNVKLDKVSLRQNPIKLSPTEPLLISQSITHLDLRECQMTVLHDNTFSGLPNLTTLNLAHNHLQGLPVDFFAVLPNLHRVYLHGNAFPCDVVEGLQTKRDVIADFDKFHCVDALSRQPTVETSSQGSSSSDVTLKSFYDRSEREEKTSDKDEANDFTTAEDKWRATDDVTSGVILYMNLAVIVIIVAAAAFVVFMNRDLIATCLSSFSVGVSKSDVESCDPREREDQRHSRETEYEEIRVEE